MTDFRVAIVDRCVNYAWRWDAEENAFSVHPAQLIDCRVRIDLTRSRPVPPERINHATDLSSIYRMLNKASLVPYRDSAPRDQGRTAWCVWRDGDTSGYLVSGPILGAPHGVYVQLVPLQASSYQVDLFGRYGADSDTTSFPGPGEAMVWIAAEYKTRPPSRRRHRNRLSSLAG